MRHRQRKPERIVQQRACCCRDRVQHVKVTNWMAQIWVLLLANAVLSMGLRHIANVVGICLFWNSCDGGYLRLALPFLRWLP
jgi:hypothetical protein